MLDQQLLKSPFSLSEARVLYELAHRDELAAKEIGIELGLDPGYLSRIVQKFDEDGLITRKPLAADRRQYRLALTAKGRQTFAKLERSMQDDVGAMLAALRNGDSDRLIAAMATIERLLGAADASPPRAILRNHRPGDMGWVVQSHGAFYASEYGFDSSFEALVAEIAAKFLTSFDASRERCWIAELDGEPVGSVFLVKHSDDVAKLRLLLVEPAGRGHGARPKTGRRMRRVREGLRLSQDHAVDPEHSGRRTRRLPGRRLLAGGERAASQLWAKPDRRDLGARAVKPGRRDIRGASRQNCWRFTSAGQSSSATRPISMRCMRCGRC